MNKVRVTKEFKFEMAHALQNYNGPCRNIHGHTYSLEVTVLGEVDSEGFVVDFKDLKSIVNENIIEVYDHALVLYKKSSFADEGLLGTKVELVDFNPTCENLLIHIVQLMKKHLPQRLILARVLLRETATSYAEYLVEDNP